MSCEKPTTKFLKRKLTSDTSEMQNFFKSSHLKV